ncbi:MAG TPA: lipoate--protein ligase family protein, partial [Planctomycetota bacterium]|nr:lipoate--protein ligase family protein [Planctomycetota bacterium]
MHLRLLDCGLVEPALNMALDEALLHGPAPATLRLYGWSPHAVSLGWFQRAAEFADLPAGTPLVRRLTGGGAIHHGCELTFALTVDAGLLPTDVAGSYALVHDALAAAIARVGITTRRLEHGHAPAARPGSRWCFAVPGRGDLLTTTGKLLGSAQRRLARPRARILHHGSLVLRRAPLTPFTAAVADTKDPDAVLPALKSAVAQALAAALGLA